MVYHETVTLTGVAATSSVGSATGSIPVTVPLDGWGVGDWGDAGWGYSNAGSEATGAVGQVVVDAEGTANVDGVAATGAVGSVVTTGTANITLTGVQATGYVNAVTQASL